MNIILRYKCIIIVAWYAIDNIYFATLPFNFTWTLLRRPRCHANIEKDRTNSWHCVSRPLNFMARVGQVSSHFCCNIKLTQRFFRLELFSLVYINITSCLLPMLDVVPIVHKTLVLSSCYGTSYQPISVLVYKVSTNQCLARTGEKWNRN